MLLIFRKSMQEHGLKLIWKTSKKEKFLQNALLGLESCAG
jgi:hypothetical protein